MVSDFPNPCDDKECDALCLLSPTIGRVCSCPNDFVLGENQYSCVANCSSSSFVCPNMFKCIPMWWKCDDQVCVWLILSCFIFKNK